MSFRLKIILGVALIEAALLAVLVWSGIRHQVAANEAELAKRAEAIATLFATASKDSVLSTDLATLDVLVREAMRNPEMIYMRVRDGEGNILAAGGAPTLPADSAGLLGRDATIVAAGALYGRIDVGLSTRSIRAAMAGTLRQAAGIALVGIVLVTVLSYLLGSYLAGRLEGLAEGTRRLAGGEFGHTVTVAGNDEIARTARSFNDMSRRIQELYGKVRDSDARNRAIMEGLGRIGEGILLIGRDKKILYMNEAMIRWFGEQTGNICHSALAGTDEQCPYCRLDEVIDEGKVVQYEPTTPDGRTFEVVALPFRGEDGTLAKLEVIREITAQKDAERGMRELIDTLTRTVSELDRFAYVAAHDLQEPLRHIVTFSQLLEKEIGSQATPTAHEHVDVVIGAARRMKALVGDLVQYSRIAAEDSSFRPCAVADAVATALDQSRRAMDDAGAAIRVGDLPTVNGNPSQLALLFQHLLGNAIKYRHPDRKPEIAVEARPDGRSWRFSVRDNGIGIEPQYGERIFEVFRRLHPADHYPGTGIGLAICRRIVERHGGRIWVESTPGQGSAFHFSIPAVEMGQSEREEPS